jgi:hypothetical protein
MKSWEVFQLQDLLLKAEKTLLSPGPLHFVGREHHSGLLVHIKHAMARVVNYNMLVDYCCVGAGLWVMLSSQLVEFLIKITFFGVDQGYHFKICQLKAFCDSWQIIRHCLGHILVEAPAAVNQTLIVRAHKDVTGPKSLRVIVKV